MTRFDSFLESGSNGPRTVSTREFPNMPLRTRPSQPDIECLTALAVVADHPGCCLCTLYACGATAAIMIQENCDPNIGKDVLECIEKFLGES